MPFHPCFGGKHTTRWFYTTEKEAMETTTSIWNCNSILVRENIFKLDFYINHLVPWDIFWTLGTCVCGYFCFFVEQHEKMMIDWHSGLLIMRCRLCVFPQVLTRGQWVEANGSGWMRLIICDLPWSRFQEGKKILKHAWN